MGLSGAGGVESGQIQKRHGEKLVRADDVQDPEALELGRAVAMLALERMRQNGSLNVRQRDQLRRALAGIAEARGWVLIPGATTDRVTKAAEDLAVLAEAGARSLKSDVADEVAAKNDELKQLQKVARAVQKMAAGERTTYPAEIEYSHTARQGSQNLVTKTDTLTLADTAEAQNAAATLEKSMEGWARLRDQMLEELAHRQQQIEQTRRNLSGFVDASRTLVGEVLEVLV
jgi:hypothetical protein